MKNLFNINDKDIREMAKTIEGHVSLCIAKPIGASAKGAKLYYVMGYQEGYAKDEAFHQVESAGVLYTLCGKLAVRKSFMACDYELDYIMPYNYKGEVNNTEMPVLFDNPDSGYYNLEAESILKGLNSGILQY